ncbi:manganese-transporting ATPase [Tanacetum coccineum]|uniref:Manganese-transporting ATPase n=1 Tax=Tanacetum coccineum TaxID=301880 RepID=A0ABQ5J608_9ASTR
MISPNKPTSKPSRVAKMSVKPIWRKKPNLCNTSNVLNTTSPIPKPLTPHYEPSQENNHPNQALPNPYIKDTPTSPQVVSHPHTQAPPQNLSILLAMHLTQQQNNIPSSPYSPNLPHTLNINQVETMLGIALGINLITWFSTRSHPLAQSSIYPDPSFQPVYGSILEGPKSICGVVILGFEDRKFNSYREEFDRSWSGFCNERGLSLGGDVCVDLINNECLVILGVEKLSIEEVQRIEWKVFDEKMKKWIQAVKVVVRYIEKLNQVIIDWQIWDVVSATRNLDRDVVEIGLTFAGFAVFNCPIKGDSAAVLLEFKQSSHDLVKITGDQALTACHVACEVNIISQPALILVPMKSKQQFEWVSPDETEIVTNSEEMVDCSNSFEGIHDAFVKKVEGAVKAWATGDPFDLATRHRHQKKYTMIMEVQISPLCYCLQKKVGIVFQFPERYFVADIVLDEVILVALHLRYALDASNIALHFSNNCGVIFVSIPCLADLFKFRDNWEHMFESDMLAFPGCYYGGGEKEKKLGKFGRCGKPYMHRYILYFKQGLLFSGEVYGRDETLSPLRALFPNIHSKDTIATKEK